MSTEEPPRIPGTSREPSSGLAPTAPEIRRRPRRARNRRRRGDSGGLLSGIPWSVRIGAIALPIILFAGPLYDAWSARQLSFRVSAVAGPAPERLDVVVFENGDRQWSLSPPPVLGTLQLAGAGPHELPHALVPDEAVLRVSAPGLGASFVAVERGESTWPVRLGPPIAFSRRVVDEDGVPVAGARVIALGGGERGVPLGEAVTDENGRFTIDTVSAGEPYVLVRVLAAGYRRTESEVRFEELEGRADQDPWPADRAMILLPSTPVRGRLVVRAGPDTEVPGDLLAGRHLAVRALPGVDTVTAEDGSFVLDHLSPRYRATLLVADLPEGFTHRRTTVGAGDEGVELLIEPEHTIRGIVINGNNGRGLPGVSVWHPHGPHGDEAVRTSESGLLTRAGAFELRDVPSGTIEITALVRIPKRDTGLGAEPPDTLRDLPGLGGPRRFRTVSATVEVEIAEDGSYEEPVVIRLY
jgi:hypothetical protein